MGETTAQTRGPYETRTEQAVKDALLALLAHNSLSDITVSQLAREAHVSRSTFYEHYRGPADVYEAVVADFARDLKPLMEQVTCSDTCNTRGTPFCALVRQSGPARPAVHESRFVESLLSGRADAKDRDLFELLVSAGYSPVEADALCTFQLAGCYFAARQTQATDDEWEGARAAIDRFILGGIAACLATKRSQAQE